MDKYIGRLLDNRYEILEVIGTGGMAVVYKARCHRLNRLVAIKILKDEYSQDEEFRRRFHAESQAVAMLSHPNIVSVYDVSTSDDADYIVMELIDGITLKQYMEKKGVLNWKETLHFAIQIAKALDHAHSRGIIHRDIKPHNVMVLKNGSVKVADFGIARVMSKSNTLTKEALGSVHYISPEQAKGGRVDNRSDLYSLGVVMYEMMTGRPPYDGESPVAVAIQHINGKAPMPSTLNPNIPGGLEQIIMKAMEPDPNRRYPTAQAMLYDMDEFRKDPTILFDYNNSSTGMDDATRIQSPAQTAAIAQAAAKSTAERVAAQNGGAVPRRPAGQTQNKPTGTRPRRSREEVVEEEEKGSKVATVSIILCSVVAVVAIVIFLVALLGGGSDIENNKNMVQLPSLLYQSLDDAAKATDYVVELDRWTYSAEFEKGMIIEQNPKAGTLITKGSTVTVVVSAGPEPSVKVMEDLVGYEEEQARNYLTNVQGVDPNRILTNYEANADVAKGCVIRTEPGVGSTLPEEGPIRLYISTGPSVKTVTMVDFVNGGYTQETAVKWLLLNGFSEENVQAIPEQSDEPEGKILFQSQAAGKQVNVTATVILKYSTGKNGNVTLPPSETSEPEDYVYKIIRIALPTDKTENYILSLYRDGVIIEERDIPVGTVEAEFRVSGKGVMTFVVMIDNQTYGTVDVDFDAPDTPEVTDGE